MLKIVVLLMVIWGSLQKVETVFNTADASMGLMATINLIAIVALSGTVVKLTRDYFSQARPGSSRASTMRTIPELRGKIDRTIWTRD